ncbi:unnamed protein product [Brachionus calyciflorus]|uniref:Uncharacterized protein n=1 Tax=Brachionus calyciflorus TaxID=104777 RepID=A0A813M358_9BILA|nr:unnamed protein product [Brachionus calyciflorus]
MLWSLIGIFLISVQLIGADIYFRSNDKVVREFLLHRIDTRPLTCYASKTIDSNEFDDLQWFRRNSSSLGFDNTKQDFSNSSLITLSTEFIFSDALIAEKSFKCCTIKNNQALSCLPATIVYPIQITNSSYSTKLNKILAFFLSSFLFLFNK